jgi:hypothetical protein
VVIEDGFRFRLACTDLPTTLSVISSYPRPAGKPGVQLVFPANKTCINSTCYADGVLFKDYAATAQPTDSDDESYLGPYVIHQRNVTRFCQHYINDSCIKQLGSVDACIASTVEAVLLGAGGNGARNSQGAAGSGLEPGELAGVVIGGKATTRMRSRV